MSVDQDILTEDVPGSPSLPSASDRSRQRRPRRRLTLGRLLIRRGADGRRVRVRKLRLLLILAFFAVLAIISAVFGMLTSVASDLPQLATDAQFKSNVESYMYDDTGQPIGAIAPPTKQAIDQWKQISPNMVHAIVSVEDRRFWTDPGIDIKGIARAFVSDITGGPREGASTIAQQFIKNALAEQDNRTILEKLREAALAFQLVHRWKRTRILTSYLNTIYFGHGAVGIESAARVYFGWAHGYDAAAPASEPPGACGDPTVKDPRRPECAHVLDPSEAAMLAGMVANPTEFDPTLHPQAALGRRKQVLRDMLAQHYITRTQYEKSIAEPLPKASQIQQPQEPAAAPYFTSWVRPQIVEALERMGVPAKVAEYRAYYGGLKVRLTINLKLQQAAQAAVDAEFPPGSGGPTASLVAIDNKTGEVRAMVSGNNDYSSTPFNLATLGHRQPGSSFKLFTLAAALSSGEYGPDSIIDSAPQDIPFKLPNGATGHFIVHNFGNTYSGPIPLSEATAISDNSVFAQVGMHVGTKRIKHFAERMGIRSPISTNPSMILGGLNTGVSALDMAHAYETEATGGLKVFNKTLGDVEEGPIGIHSIVCPVCSQHYIVNRPNTRRVLSPAVAATMKTLLEGVVGPGGTAPTAAIPGVVVAGKTGTTSNYVDAWFVGWTPQMTTAVWVGYPNKAIPMTTDYNGAPVEGGTYPALIWKNFMVQALQILASEQPGSSGTSTLTTPALVTPTVSSPSTPVTPTTPTTPATTTPSNTGTGANNGAGGTTGGTGNGGNGNGSGSGSGSGGAGTGGAAPGG
jgi:penicillin-binding protein 1A